jgi:hypothetical protein
MRMRLWAAVAPVLAVLVSGSAGIAYTADEPTGSPPPDGVCADRWAAKAAVGPSTGYEAPAEASIVIAASDDATQHATVTPLKGRWRRIANPPFATYSPVTVWTGDRVLVVDKRKRRAATYDPSSDRWTELARAPSSLRRAEDGAHGWTGQELIFPWVEYRDDGQRYLAGLALDPSRDQWRELAAVAVDPSDPDEDRVATGTVWTGERLVIVTPTHEVAAYDPVADCWDVLPPVPGERYAWNVYWTGSTLLGETRGDSGIILSEFDPATGEWSEPIASPLRDMYMARDGAAWFGDKLAYVTWHSGGLEGPVNALFDPATTTWALIEHGCHVGSVNPTEAGRVWIAGSGRQALDPNTWQCYDLPPRPKRFLGGGVAWTGEDLIVVSGGLGEANPPRKGSYAYRPPAWVRVPTLGQIRSSDADIGESGRPTPVALHSGGTRIPSWDEASTAFATASHHKDFAGVWYDTKRDRLPVFMTTRDPGTEAKHVAGMLGEDAAFEVWHVEHTDKELTEVGDAVSDLRAVLLERGVLLVSVGTNVQRNRVDVGIQGPMNLAREVLSEFGDVVRIHRDQVSVFDV